MTLTLTFVWLHYSKKLSQGHETLRRFYIERAKSSNIALTT